MDTTRAGSYELPTSVPRLDFHDTFKAHNSPRKTMMFGGDRCTVQYAVMTASDWLRLGVCIGVVAGYRCAVHTLGLRGDIRIGIWSRTFL